MSYFYRCACTKCGEIFNLSDKDEHFICYECKDEKENENYDELDFWHTEKIKCPYCSYEFSNSLEYNLSNDGETTNISCQECGREFDIEFNVEITYTTSRNDK